MDWFNGCPFVGTSGIDPQKLPGTWRATADDTDYIWTFSADGTMRLQIEPRPAWVRFFGGSLDLRGRWQLKGDQLTIELAETPPLQALFGQYLQGEKATLRIQQLTSEELRFVGDDPPFRRVPAPAK